MKHLDRINNDSDIGFKCYIYLDRGESFLLFLSMDSKHKVKKDDSIKYV